MAMKGSLLVLLLFVSSAIAVINDPFCPGFSMSNLGTILNDQGNSGTQPWLPAAFCDSSIKTGCAVAIVSFYDEMDNYQDRSQFELSGGYFFNSRYVNCKATLGYFNFLDTYYEQSLFVSTAVSLLRNLRISLECKGIRFGLNKVKDATRTIGEIGFSAWFKMRYSAIAFQCNHLVIKSSNTDGTDPKYNFTCGIHTIKNRLGAQGVVIEITPEEPKPIRLKIGEEILPLKWLGIHGALANNPVQVSFGVSIDLKRASTAFSLINHPQLGWSKGIFMEYSK